MRKIGTIAEHNGSSVFTVGIRLVKRITKCTVTAKLRTRKNTVLIPAKEARIRLARYVKRTCFAVFPYYSARGESCVVI